MLITGIDELNFDAAFLIGDPCEEHQDVFVPFKDGEWTCCIMIPEFTASCYTDEHEMVSTWATYDTYFTGEDELKIRGIISDKFNLNI